MVPNHKVPRKSCFDCIPDHPLNSDFVTRLKNALEAGDEKVTMDLLCNEVKHVDAIIELSNDDWMKDPAAQLHPLVLVVTSPEEDLCSYLMIAKFAQETLKRDFVKSFLKVQTNYIYCFTPSTYLLILSKNLKRCAKALVRFGALVNLPSEDIQETPLHIAAKHGLYEHMHLYLRYGAVVDKKNSLEESALSVACREAKEIENQESYLQVCKLLLTYGAEVNTVDEEVKTPLHKACRNAHHSLVQILLQRKADVNAIDYNGAYPMSCVLQAAAFKQELRPHLTVQTLLNHGSQKIWPTAFVKVLKSCASVPEIIEILCNSYPHLPISEKWVEIIPKEEFQRHQPFYESFVNQMYTVRTLQHLCRCAIRKKFGSRCHDLIPFLPVPKPLQNYLLLEPVGVLL